MKKLLLLAGIMALTLSTQAYAADTNTTATTTKAQECSKPCNIKDKPPICPNKTDFEKRLKLTDEQKAKVKEIHQNGFKEIKPIMDKIELKREELKAIKRSQLAPEEQASKIVQLRKELRTLRHQAREVQMNNMKEFESILTDKQKTEFNKIKEEGRKKFEKEHKKKGAFNFPPMGPKPGIDND